MIQRSSDKLWRTRLCPQFARNRVRTRNRFLRILCKIVYGWGSR